MKRYALKKCPFCGGTPDIVKMECGPPYDGKTIIHYVACPCSACGPVNLRSNKQAAEEWNHRGKKKPAKKMGVKKK